MRGQVARRRRRADGCACPDPSSRVWRIVPASGCLHFCHIVVTNGFHFGHLSSRERPAKSGSFCGKFVHFLHLFVHRRLDFWFLVVGQIQCLGELFDGGAAWPLIPPPGGAPAGAAGGGVLVESWASRDELPASKALAQPVRRLTWFSLISMASGQIVNRRAGEIRAEHRAAAVELHGDLRSTSPRHASRRQVARPTLRAARRHSLRRDGVRSP